MNTKSEQLNTCSKFVSTRVGAARRRDRVGNRPGAGLLPEARIHTISEHMFS